MPKQIIKTVYTVDELEPSSYDRALDSFRRTEYAEGVPWMDEIMDSLRGIFESIDGVSLRDWLIDWDNSGRSWIKLGWDNVDIGELCGVRAQAWLENNLMYKLRENRSFIKRVTRYSEKVYSFYRQGQYKSCPFTGVCYDDDLIDALVKNINSGMSVEDSLHDLADVASRLGEAEIEAALSEENFKEMCEANDWTFDEFGEMQ